MNLLELLKSDLNWKKELRDNGIRFTQQDNLIIFNYDMMSCNFSKKYQRECRGSIVNLDTNEFVCRAYDKFFNAQETKSDRDKINWNDVTVYEKLDGSLIKIWWYDGEWRVSTNGVIYAQNSRIDADILGITNFYQLVEKTVGNFQEYCNRQFSEIDKSSCHMFELCTPVNRVVVPHNDYKMYYLSSRNNQTGIEYFKDNFEYIPKTYNIKSMEECLEVASKLPFNEEGYIVYSNGYRVKVKSLQYVEVHHIKDNGNLFMEKSLYNIVRIGEYDEVTAYFNELKEPLDKIQNEFNSIVEKMKQSIDEFEKQDFNRTNFKQMAQWINSNYKYVHHLMAHMRGKDWYTMFVQEMEYDLFVKTRELLL